MRASTALVRLLRPALDPGSLEYRYQMQGVFVAGSVLVFVAAAFRTWATAEMWFWLFGCSELILAITLKLTWFAAAMFVSFVTCFVFIFMMRRSQKESEK